ncbi:uncharacterized protein [Argopecten irradians]|uniref:uncharacterized protein isoform X2 n=1 Tax=Argopecten irradians TaxID=31199 RepID=UPI0037115C38
MEESGVTVEELLLKYSNRNLTYKEISYALKKRYGLCISHDAIRKRLKKIGSPSRRGPTINTQDEVTQAIQAEILEHPVTVGYRHMTYTLRHKGIHVRRDTVMKIMKEIDPEGVEFRRKRRIRRRIYRSLGPNYTWHVDGYDKLKPFGFAIHGCIDGFSRRVMWLKVGPTNNNPGVVAAHYVECVDLLKGCPRILQADPGTENVILGVIQCLVRQDDHDVYAGERSFRTVRSVFNQRIEAWWSMFRRHESQWWMDLFKGLELFGAFDRRNTINIYCLRYCFMPLLQENLDMLKFQWNSHHISKSRRRAPFYAI